MIKQPTSIAALVPFYNEAGRIGQVLRLLRQSQLLSQIIAVDDGSTDGCLKEAQAEPEVTILHQDNKGKSAAVQLGLTSVKTDYVLLFDADSGDMTLAELDGGLELLGKPIAQVTQRDKPEKVDMVLFFKRQSRLLSPDGTDFLSGQRVLPTADLHVIYTTYQPTGFGLETDINDYMFQQKRGVVWVQTEVWHQSKLDKYGVVTGSAHSFKMFKDLCQVGTFQKFGQWKKVWFQAVSA